MLWQSLIEETNFKKDVISLLKLLKLYIVDA